MQTNLCFVSKYYLLPFFSSNVTLLENTYDHLFATERVVNLQIHWASIKDLKDTMASSACIKGISVCIFDLLGLVFTEFYLQSTKHKTECPMLFTYQTISKRQTIVSSLNLHNKRKRNDCLYIKI